MPVMPERAGSGAKHRPLREPGMNEAAAPASILAFDYGTRRIGVAVGQTVTGSASPLATLRNGDGGPDFASIENLVREWRPDQVVVGQPRQAHGSLGAVGEAAVAFGKVLERYDLPVVMVDERGSSREAEAVLRGARKAGPRGRIRKEQIDAAAAVFIAERYLLSLQVGKMPAR